MIRKKVILLIIAALLILCGIFSKEIVTFFVISLAENEIKYSNNVNTKFIQGVLWDYINKIDVQTIHDFLKKSKNLVHSETLIARCVVSDKKDVVLCLKEMQHNSLKEVKIANREYFMSTIAIVALEKDILTRVPLCQWTSDPYAKRAKVYLTYRNEILDALQSTRGELKEIAEKLATKYSRKRNDETYSINFNSPYYYGDHVNFDSPMNGKGTGYITAITVDEDGFIDYLISLDDGSNTIIGGICPQDIISGKCASVPGVVEHRVPSDAKEASYSALRASKDRMEGRPDERKH
jgi:hypothetical protein